MAEIIKLDFAAYEPKLTPKAQAAFDSWRQVKDNLIHSCRKVRNWVWAGVTMQEINTVKRLCRDFPQPMSEDHMSIVLETILEVCPDKDEPEDFLPLKIA